MSALKTAALAARAALWASGFVLLWGYLATLARRYDVALGGPLPTWLRVPGALLAAAGGALALWCIVLFVVRGAGTPAPFDAPRQFVAVGPYRRVRNPMYWGGAGVLSGAGLMLRSPGVLLVGAGLVLCAHWFVVLVEEPGLERRFGDSYREYKRTVRRWLPR